MMKLSFLLVISLLAIHLQVIAQQQEVKPRWMLQSSGVSTSVRGASAVNAKVCWLGTLGGVLRTTDGGKNWNKIAIEGADSLDFRDVQAFSDQMCIAMSAGSGAMSRIYKTTDGGKSWKLVKQNIHEKGFYNGMAFWDEQIGLLAGDPVFGTLYLLKTIDGGDSWTEVNSKAAPPLKEGEYGFAASGTHIAVQGSQRAFIGTGGNVARVFYTEDQGRTWHVSQTPMVSGASSQGIFSIAFKSREFGMAVGGDYSKEREGYNNVIVSHDGGKEWKLVKGPDLDFRSCIAFNDTSIIVVGPSGSEISYDDGNTFISLGDQGFHTLTVSPDGAGIWAAGAGGVVAKLEW